MIRALTFSLLLWLSLPAHAIDPSDKLEDPVQDELYQRITEEVRCLVCQNQSIANSTAPLAADLRREIRRMIEEGSNETEIKDFLVERYGDFVLYRPRFRSWNLVLWLGPIVLLTVGFIALVVNVRRRKNLPVDEDAP
ncbi:MAG: cytochrome c-type biogenesis protein CcmH [Gammaproteobacteria bacterium]|nr:cytochrome c-type biogenesis protein CcmH [Gammaproteobacteria bacterium]MDP6616556.1 cytochrome c-type biogenesis protein CcmH [Gammaproteobacteria bacterium]MDP6694195.1 cytochrome c-type biogenesis protein CcmH [Gammaproteobacteria bacterium]